MTAAERLSPVNLGLMLGILLLATLLALQLRDGSLVAPGGRSDRPRGGADAGMPPLPEGARLEEFRSFTDRPLFSPTRRAAAPASLLAASATPPAVTALPNFELVGIVAAGAERFVLLREAGGRAQRLSAGQSLAGWQLTAIGSDRVTVANGAQRVELLLVRRRGADPMPVNEPWLTPPKPPTVPQK